MFNSEPEIAEIMPTVNLINRPQLTKSLCSMSENQLNLYHSLKLDQHLTIMDCGNDPKGNPRRAWVIADEKGNAVLAYDEGYYGRDCVPGSIRRDFDYAPTIKCSSITYLMLIKLPHPPYLPEQY